MKPSRLMIAVIVLTLTFLVTFAVAPASAKSKKSAEPDAVKKSTITAVDTKDGTVTIQFKGQKTPRVYKVDEVTQVTLNISKGTIADIRVGMEVSDSVERDAHTLDRITLQGSGLAPVEPAKPKAKAKAKKPAATT